MFQWINVNKTQYYNWSHRQARVFNVSKKSTEPILDFRKSAQIKKLQQNDYANDLRKTIRSRDREHQFQQNFLGVK